MTPAKIGILTSVTTCTGWRWCMRDYSPKLGWGSNCGPFRRNNLLFKMLDTTKTQIKQNRKKKTAHEQLFQKTATKKNCNKPQKTAKTPKCANRKKLPKIARHISSAPEPTSVMVVWPTATASPWVPQPAMSHAPSQSNATQRHAPVTQLASSSLTALDGGGEVRGGAGDPQGCAAWWGGSTPHTIALYKENFGLENQCPQKYGKLGEGVATTPAALCRCPPRAEWCLPPFIIIRTSASVLVRGNCGPGRSFWSTDGRAEQSRKQRFPGAHYQSDFLCLRTHRRHGFGDSRTALPTATGKKIATALTAPRMANGNGEELIGGR